ncbi:MAG: argininosuccinate lyase [Clostridia bacterium]|nr:argininosuccinate lyase [Clostridia bacterium]
MKMWGGRFQKSTDAAVDDFNSSIRFDKRLYRQDIMGSIAHAKMLGKQNIISQNDAELICKTLLEILSDIENGEVNFLVDAEDIHMNIEKILTDRIGETGKRLHTGRSRNDQVALDLRMYMKDAIDEMSKEISRLTSSLIGIAEENTETVMPGYTHLQKAQPITFAHHIMAYVQMFLRDLDRLSDCKKRTDVMPLGSGALAGTTYPLDRFSVAAELGFSAVTENSLDGVSDRDFALEAAFCMSVIMMHMSRFSEELILWSSNEFSFVEMDDAYSTGSSIMPQKKNPDVAELIRGKTGRVYGSLMGLLTMMKGIPLAYNKDMQEDKEQLFDALDTVLLCVPVFRKMIETMKINKNVMRRGANGGYTNATDAADYLVKRGMAFRDAHEVIGKLVFYSISQGKALDELSMEEFKEFSGVFDSDIYDAISVETCVSQRNIYGAPAKDAVETAIKNAKKSLEAFKK